MGEKRKGERDRIMRKKGGKETFLLKKGINVYEINLVRKRVKRRERERKKQRNREREADF